MKREHITSVGVENLDLAIRELSDQVGVLRQVLDEIREDLSFAVRNDRLTVVPVPASDRSLSSLSREIDGVIERIAATGGQLGDIRSAVAEQSQRTQIDCTDGSPSDWPDAPGSQSQPPTVQKSLFCDEVIADQSDAASHRPESDAADVTTAITVDTSNQPQPTVNSVNDEQRSDTNRFDRAIAELCDALAAGKSDQLRTFLTTLSTFHQYSFGNVLLISLQRPDASHVAGFRTWKKLGRNVRKGEKGIAILAPILSSKRKGPSTTDTEQKQTDESDEPRTAKRPRGFRTVHVFDISQTDGDPLPEFPAAEGQPGVLLTNIRLSIRNSGIDLIEDFIPGGALGISEGGRITIRPDLSEAESFKTLVHEYAHELLHKDQRRLETTKTIRETEAEAVAFAVCHAVGFDLNTSSSDYIQLYNGSKETLLASLEHIRRCTNIILDDSGPTYSDFEALRCYFAR